MDAVEVSEPGGPEVLKLVRRPVPEAAPGEILINVESAGLNGADLSQRKGTYPMPPGVTDIPTSSPSGVTMSSRPPAIPQVWWLRLWRAS